MPTVGNLRVQINATSNLRKEMRATAEEVRRSRREIERLRGTTQATTATLDNQGSAAADAAKKVAKFTAQHAAAIAAMKGAETVIRNNTVATAALSQRLRGVTDSFAAAGAARAAFTGGLRTTAKFIVGRVLPPIALLLGAAGIKGLIQRMTEFGAAGAEVVPVAQAFDNLSEHVGTTGDALRLNLSQAVAGTVSDFDLMKTSVIALNSEAIKSPEVLAEVASHARTLGRTVGLDTTEAFDNLVRGIGLMRPQLLKSVGVLVSVDEATRSWAEANNRTVGSLTDAERHTAFLQATMEKLRIASERAGGTTDDLGTIVAQNEAAQENFRRAMQKAVGEAENIKLVNKEWTQFKTGIIELNQSILPGLAHGLAEVVGLMGRLFTQPLAEGGPGGQSVVGGFDDVAEVVARIRDNAKEAADELDRIVLPIGGFKGGVPERPRIRAPALPTKAFVDLAEEMERVNTLSEAMGDHFDATSAKQKAIRSAIEDAISDGWDPMSDKVQGLVDDLEELGDTGEDALKRIQDAVEDLDLSGVGTFGRGGGLAIPGATGRAGMSRSTALLSGPLELQGLREELSLTSEQAARLAKIIGDVGDESSEAGPELQNIDRAVRGVVAFADATGVLDGRLRDAARGVSDLIGGIEGFGSADSILGKIGSGLGIAGGIVGVVSSLFPSNELDANTLALRRATESIERMTGTLEGQSSLLARRQQALDIEDPRQAFDELKRALLDTVPFDESSPLMNTLENLTPENIGEVLANEIDAVLKGLSGGRAIALERAGISMEEYLDFLSQLERLADDIQSADEATSAAAEAAKRQAQANRDAARATDEAAEAARRFSETMRRELARRQGFINELTARQLEAQGFGGSARMVRQEARFAREIREAQRLVEQGILDEGVLDQLRKVQQLEREALKQELNKNTEATEEAARQSETVARRMSASRSATISEITGISTTQAARMSDILTSINVWTRETAHNTRPIRGGRDIPLGQVGARAPSGDVVRVSVNFHGPVTVDDPERFGRDLANSVADEVDNKLGRKAKRDRRLTGEATL